MSNQTDEWQDGDGLTYDDDYVPPPVHGIHATDPVVKDGCLVCTVCESVLLVLSPDMFEHNTDRG